MPASLRDRAVLVIGRGIARAVTLAVRAAGGRVVVAGRDTAALDAAHDDFAPRMPEDGSFVLFSGSSALKPTIGMLAVGATNGAVDVVTRSLAVELAPIRVNAISPGTIGTGAYDGLGEQRKADLFAARTEHNPARRIGTPEDIAEAVVFALTSTFMTGVSLGVDGGEPLV